MRRSFLVTLTALALLNGLPTLAMAAGERVDRRAVDMNNPGRTAPALRLDAGAPEDAGTAPTGLNLRLPREWNITTPVDSEPLELSVENAVFLALRNNRSLAVQQLEPLIRGTFEAVERAQFDPAVFAEVVSGRSSVTRQDEFAGATFAARTQTERLQGGLRQRLATGTDLELSISADRADSDRTDEQFGSRVGIGLTQALLRGASRESNLASLRQAELDSLASIYELRGFSEALVADVENAYWDYILTDSQTSIFLEALNVAEQQLEQTIRRIEVGQRPETEETAARAEVALRRQGLINARNQRERSRLALLQLINPPGAGWAAPIRSLDSPQVDDFPLDPVEDHVTLGLRLRPDLNEARLQVQRGELEVVRTRHGILPRLDLFVTLGKTGYSNAFGDAWRDIDGPSYELSAGLSFEAPIGNRTARAERQRAGLSRQQAVEAVSSLAQFAALDVQLAWLEVDRAREQINATAVTRALQEEVLRAEQARFDVGSGTALAVAQAQRDLLESRLDEVEAAIRYRQALTALHQQSGTLLIRRGIEAPGAEEIILR
ncbi:MAG: TolC family protein [Aquisalimonadaceae bacterium]